MKGLSAELGDLRRHDVGLDPTTSEIQRRTIRPFSICSQEVRPRPSDHYLVAEEFDVKVHEENLITTQKGAGRSLADPVLTRCK